jgi:hypothetical protein
MVDGIPPLLRGSVDVLYHWEVFPHWPWCRACGNLCWHSHCIFHFVKTPCILSWGLVGASHPHGGINNSNLMLSLEGVPKLTH